MKFCIVIPAHNEEKHLAQTLESLVAQTLQPAEIHVVNDHSSDGTQTIIEAFSEKHAFITYSIKKSKSTHAPGSKVIEAFNLGLRHLNNDYDILCKFDADLIFPKNYLERISTIFENNPKCGMAGGFCYIEKNGTWQLEGLTNKDHLRGALKAYRKPCFQQIGGLRPAMGWDTADELLAKYNGWQVCTDTSLHVKHLKPTGNTYTKVARYKQGEAFYTLRYGFLLTVLASAKLAVKKQSIRFFFHCLTGYLRAKRNKKSFLLNEAEGAFARKLRWRGIRAKILG
jgi:glycosyltransferase involved in cell wall biosynthesis